MAVVEGAHLLAESLERCAPRLSGRRHRPSHFRFWRLGTTTRAKYDGLLQVIILCVALWADVFGSTVQFAHDFEFLNHCGSSLPGMYVDGESVRYPPFRDRTVVRDRGVRVR